ncbi:hypothetical protein FHS72_001026 [Loktanella ponticola]|uniref:Uncharacterized protein n=1 Tax=Yoonia ponticola TaxID=1524255 RepID=A0A7W9BJ07_9RHOB|nr:hypothetical protein [Yoonia ponticola]
MCNGPATEEDTRMAPRSFFAIFLSLMILISASGYLQSFHVMTTNNQSNSVADMRGNSTTAMVHAGVQPERVTKSSHVPDLNMHKSHGTALKGKSENGHNMKKCCSSGQMVAGCALMPISTLNEPVVWSKPDNVHVLVYLWHDTLWPSIRPPTPQLPPRIT